MSSKRTMRVIALVSGGKDSCYNMVQCVAEGHEIVALANLRPPDKDEMDSYMFQTSRRGIACGTRTSYHVGRNKWLGSNFQSLDEGQSLQRLKRCEYGNEDQDNSLNNTVGYQAVELYADAMGLPLFRRTIEGSSIETGKDYEITSGDEVEDMYELLKMAKEAAQADAVSVGAILSDYQRVRVEHVCSRLKLVVLAYLWRRDQAELLSEMIRTEIKSIIIKVAAMGLLPDKHLSLSLDAIHPTMVRLNREYGLNICGEGGEYETFTLDCPLFKKRIVVDEFEKVIHSDDAFAPVGYVTFKSLHLEEKNSKPATAEELAHLSIKHSQSLIKELFSPEELEKLPEIRCLREADLDATPAVTITRPIVKEFNRHFWVSNLIGHGNSVTEASHCLIDSLYQCLSLLSADAKNIHAVNLYVKSMSDYDTVNAVYNPCFGLNPPVRVCVEASLPENFFFMMDVAGSFKDDHLARHTMHVQGLSHWAPSNIGPYSQAVKIDGQILMAGQIGLCPATMKLIDHGFVAEARLSLRHVQRVLAAMNPAISLENVNLCVCYVTQTDFIEFAQEEWNRALDKEGLRDDSSESSYSLVEFVVIPGLPRGAMVEWHCRSSENQLGEINEYKSHIKNFNINFEYQKLHQSGFFGLRGTLMKMSSVDNEALSVSQIVPEFFCLFDKILKDNNLDWNDVPLMKIMYRNDCFDYENLRSLLHGCLEENYTVTPYTLLPVQRLTDISCVLSVLL